MLASGQLGHTTSRRCEAAKLNCGSWSSNITRRTFFSTVSLKLEKFKVLSLLSVISLSHWLVVLCFPAAVIIPLTFIRPTFSFFTLPFSLHCPETFPLDFSSIFTGVFGTVLDPGPPRRLPLLSLLPCVRSTSQEKTCPHVCLHVWSRLCCQLLAHTVTAQCFSFGTRALSNSDRRVKHGILFQMKRKWSERKINVRTMNDNTWSFF